MKPNLLITILLICVLAACNPTKPTGVSSKKAAVQPADLNGSWQLNEISDPPVPFDSLYYSNRPRVVFDINNSRASGNTSCNDFSGTINVKESTLTFVQPMTLTRMSCPGQGESFFLRNIARVSTWALIDSSTLVLVTSDMFVMKFVKLP